jgi:hypothetical protein
MELDMDFRKVLLMNAVFVGWAISVLLIGPVSSGFGFRNLLVVFSPVLLLALMYGVYRLPLKPLSHR